MGQASKVHLHLVLLTTSAFSKEAQILYLLVFYKLYMVPNPLNLSFGLPEVTFHYYLVFFYKRKVLSMGSAVACCTALCSWIC